MITNLRAWFARASRERRVAELGVALLSAALAVSSPARAVPITYELIWELPNLSGTLNGTPFTGAFLDVTFEGDTTTVLPFTVQGPRGPVSGYINLVGTATFFISGANGFFAQGTFLPSAGIFVSVDNVNGGIGVGSFGVPPSNPNFPGQVAYPAGILTPTGAVATYDLKSDFLLTSGFAISWVGFPASPPEPGIPLPTTSGDLILDHQGISASEFSARTQASTPFTSMSAEAEVAPARFELQGHFSLGATSDGINPLSEAVTLQLDSYSVTIAPGSFRRSRRGGFEFEGKINDVRLRFSFRPRDPAHYGFEVEGAGPGVPQLTDTLSLLLTIGDDSGSATVSVESR